MKKIFVISGINLVHGGPFTVFRDFINIASANLDSDWEIIVLCNNKDLIESSRVKCLEYPYAKKSWFLRLYYEWFIFHYVSKNINADVWFSMSDISPNIVTKKRLVYLHNPSPFYRLSMQEIFLEPKLFLFNLFYMYLYKINLNSNSFLVVQQSWIRDKFSYFFPKNKIIVSYPISVNPPSVYLNFSKKSDKYIFIYPAVPRVFKNFELIGRAVELLSQNIKDSIEIYITIDGSENRYAKKTVERFKHLSCIKFIGYQNNHKMLQLYQLSDVLLFPSRLETWGLPISEAISLGKQLLVADLPYSHETAGNYNCISFLPMEDASSWALAISKIVTNDWIYSTHANPQPTPPFARDWDDLLKMIVVN